MNNSLILPASRSETVRASDGYPPPQRAPALDDPILHPQEIAESLAEAHFPHARIYVESPPSYAAMS